MTEALHSHHRDATVRRTNKHIVFAAHPPPSGYPARWSLGPMDYYVGLGIPIQVVFVFEPSPDQHDDFIPLERLITAMSALLDHHPHFSGRLREDEQDHQPYITTLGSGAEVIEAHCDQALSSYQKSGDYIITSFPKDFLSPYEPTPEYLAKHPFFAIQHTRFACGGVALAVRVAHAVVDGVGFFSVVRDLRDIYNQLCRSDAPPRLSHTPSLAGYMADWARRASPEEVQDARKIQPQQYQLVQDSLSSGSNGVTLSSDNTDKEVEDDKTPSIAEADPVIGRVLRFSAKHQSELKSLATNPGANEGEYITTFDALCAYVLQQTYRARTSPTRLPSCSPDRCNFLTPSDWRKALNLPPNHTPNTCFVNFCDLTPELVLDGPAHAIARAVHQVSRSLSLADAKSQLRWLCAQADKSKAQLAFSYGDGSLLLSSWLKMDLYDALSLSLAQRGPEERRIRPAVTFTPFTQVSLIDGLGYFLPIPPSSSMDGEASSVDLALALKESVWREMDRASSKLYTIVG
ncbi:hypothetical protein CBOM_04816 [Ceraceosorus bombacis]|uniref:Transferase n=1 Tax=Ceraceosorus bombacis TaxID=401625 RepID=A0A0P1BPE4_9BASI|nr:hypothetical protein CBOM_04816 [Ceraceosorus bombacis]